MRLHRKNTVLAKGTRPGNLLKRPRQVGRLIKLEDAAYDAMHRVDEGPDAEKRYRNADRAYQRELKRSTPAEREAAENAIKHAPYLKGR